MAEFTKEQLIKQAKKNIEVLRGAAERIPGASDAAVIHLKLAEITLASLEAERVGCDACGGNGSVDIDHGEMGIEHIECPKCYTAPPAPVVTEDISSAIEALKKTLVSCHRYNYCSDAVKRLEDACRAAMLQGADTELQRKAAIHDALCEKYNVESMTDFVDWQRNHIAELEAAPPAPVGPGETAVMPDYPGYTMTQRECFQAGKKAGLAEAGNSPVIPDGWVACSQRLPETDGNYWGWWSESKRQGPVWFIKSELQAQFQSSEITHWMPLPAAPQQEVK